MRGRRGLFFFFLFFFSLVTIQTHTKLNPGKQVYLGLETPPPPPGEALACARRCVLLFLGVLRPRVTSGPPAI